MKHTRSLIRGNAARISLVVAVIAAAISVRLLVRKPGPSPSLASVAPAAPQLSPRGFEPRLSVDSSGFTMLSKRVAPAIKDGSLETSSAGWRNAGWNQAREVDEAIATGSVPPEQQVALLAYKAVGLNYEGAPEKAYKALVEARALAEKDRAVTAHWLYTLIYLQGITGLRLGETENCLHCRGASACIIPFDLAAVHRIQRGSRSAVKHFTEYLSEFPDDLQVRWLLNVAEMTLGEYPKRVDPRYLVSIDRFAHSEFDIGKFKDISYLIGLERTNDGGGGVMDDFDNDGRLDLFVTSFDPNQPAGFFHNTGKGAFVDRSREAKLLGQLGGINCVQGDFNNDGFLDVFISRGAWINAPVRQSLLRNTGHGVFADVTEAAGLSAPANSNSAQWADYDNDGYLDLFVCCETQPNRLYHNERNGTFKEAAAGAGLLNTKERFCKGATWIDFDNDDYPDLFVNYLDGSAHLFHNDRNGHFTDVTEKVGINGPLLGFSCWNFDYDNDGWPDIFATCYRRSTAEVVKGLSGEPVAAPTSKLFHNIRGQRFEDVTASAGLDHVFSTMGSNFGDLDNDGLLDIYLATGEPDLGTLIPNRLFKNVDGRRFSEITASSGTGHLQKGHSVAFGDWDRDGNVDLFVEMGGAAPGDKYHNLLFQNPGHKNQWLTVKLVGTRTNRSAIGARIKVVTAGPKSQTIYRYVSSGSSFGGNPLQQTIGLGQASRIDLLEIHWPTSHTTQSFRNVSVDQPLEITELAAAPRVLNWPKLPVPAATAAPVMSAQTP